ncbi:MULTISPECIES: SipW-dependent-type signal peptide-containing protein [unclassified Dietzia]|uniref:SipW-dependent-type signal peptide-containing protein n=1 Tax=unclassified Dietzia TaxID=2617939 RepID=UPI001315E7F9|nr:MULTISPECIES: SipW-dependent-type signal peptide-containing protein [unclassified Dietzia]MBB1025591.1 hypothetical protein [Dietzia sp. DQ12-76]MBB1026415.1 hypothetical protein [Dietzia sp. DQ11-38-2]QGW25951.1 hypothetical protein GJR88_04497 [Dietzia sp. DQ12-45-1b]
MSDSPSPASTTDRRRRVRALLAGGLVLGLGAAGTLAAWTDSEFARGVFTSGQFNIQGNESTSTPPANGTWTDHYTAAGAAQLQFSTGFNSLSPGSTVYAPFSLRIDPTRASYGATVHIRSTASTGDTTNLMPKLSWKARTGIAPATCAAGTFTGGTPLVPSPDGAGVPMNYTAPATPPSFTLSNAGAPSTTPVSVCFAVTMQPQPANVAPNDPSWTFTTPVTTTWEFSAESTP